MIAKHGKEIVDKVKSYATNESFEQLLKELEKHKDNLFKKDVTENEFEAESEPEAEEEEEVPTGVEEKVETVEVETIEIETTDDEAPADEADYEYIEPKN